MGSGKLRSSANPAAGLDGDALQQNKRHVLETLA
jgi:hypothetical protein